MAVIKLSWLYLVFRPIFLNYRKVHTYVQINSSIPRKSPDDLDLAPFEWKIFHYRINFSLIQTAIFMTLWQKITRSIISSFVVLRFFWHELFIAAFFSSFRQNWICGEDLKMRNGFYPFLDVNLDGTESLWFFKKIPQISTVAKLRILTNERRVKSLLTLKNKFQEIGQLFWDRGRIIKNKQK